MMLASAAVKPLALARGDERVRAAVTENFACLWRFLRRMGVAEQDAEDAGQAVLLVFAQRVSSVAVGAERSFLLGTALRVAADYRKRGHRVREVAVDHDVLATELHPGPGTDEEAERKRCRARLDEVLEGLPAGMREVFVLSELEEMTMAEIASALGIPSGTVASRLRRARELFEAEAAALRSRLEKENPR
jgi:RNA polymerase sigma-70 factor, ECF subfamily